MIFFNSNNYYLNKERKNKNDDLGVWRISMVPE